MVWQSVETKCGERGMVTAKNDDGTFEIAVYFGRKVLTLPRDKFEVIDLNKSNEKFERVNFNRIACGS